MAKIFKYILDFQANTEKFSKEAGGLQGMLKGAAVAAGALFAADKIMDAAKAVYDYANEISTTKIAVQTLAQVQGAAADQMAGQVTAIAKSYNQDVNESIKASNVIMKAFGENSKTAFDLLNLGFAGAANANGDMLQQVSEYAPHFAEAGLSAQEMFGVISAGNKMGIFDDKAADSIKEASIRLREMTQGTRDALTGIGLSSTEIQRSIADGSMSMFDVMQKVSAQLQKFPQQSPAVGAALADIFGGPGEDAVNFIRSLHEVDASMQGLIEDSVKEQVRWTEALGEFHTIGAQVFGGTSELITKIKTVGLEMVNSLIKGVVNIANYFIDLYNESMAFRAVIQLIKLNFQSLYEYAKLILTSIGDYFKGIGKAIKAVFTGDWKSIGGIIEETFNEVKDNAAGFGTKMAENFTNAVENTLTPKKKIELISLSATAAAEAGKSAGDNFLKGVAESAALAMPSMQISPKLKVKDFELGEIEDLGAELQKEMEQVGLSIKMDDAFALETAMGNVANQMSAAALQAKAYGTEVDLLAEKKRALTEQINNLIAQGFTSESEALQSLMEQYRLANEQEKQIQKIKETATQVGDAVGGAFESMGNRIVDSLGLADTGMEGFVKSLASTAIQLISTYLAQSIASAIAGASSSAAATGPAAVFTQPAFLATAIGGILTAFAAIPEFAAGGMVTGPTLAMVGEYPNARNNPEVIGKFSDFRNMWGETGTPARQEVVVTIDGKMRGEELYFLQKKTERKVSRRG